MLKDLLEALDDHEVFLLAHPRGHSPAASPRTPKRLTAYKITGRNAWRYSRRSCWSGEVTVDCASTSVPLC